ncbi:hypothetical protein [Candidatus Uabimicrobium amorphum]|uniref:Roadblock/LAMTOR2 domain-containing protein n=1 Tax=Uabimicrobium amorphum TaxID=2596890 RepID=A0A5S9IJK6_UABAM|nr:hypothetical protein [Candidatus Uabimicrobium amorphum]BBM82904.1 hypothetical protein UABAM_01247 [Candidatus Uabimicrobium amorphum]
MSVDSIIAKCIGEVPKALAAGVIDLDMGMLLNVKTVDSHPSEVLDLVAAATKDLFEGDNVTAIENTFKKMRGVESDERYFQEMLITSANLLHYFGRLKSNPRIAIVVVCRVDANIGMVMSKSRAIVNSETT